MKTISVEKHLFYLALTFFVVGGCTPSDQENKWMPKILDKEIQKENFLPDYSYAGYKWGEEPIPEFKGKIVNVEDFGAVPNDKKDDTKAITSALEAANKVDGPVILFFPKGRFILKNILYIERSNIVIRGSGAEGENATTLYMPLALNELPTPKDFSSEDNTIGEENIEE